MEIVKYIYKHQPFCDSPGCLWGKKFVVVLAFE